MITTEAETVTQAAPKMVQPTPITSLPEGSPASGLQLGDIVYYVDPETHAGVINPRVKAAVVAGIHAGGTNLTLTVYGRIPGRLMPNVPYAPAENDANFSWHHRPERLKDELDQIVLIQADLRKRIESLENVAGEVASPATPITRPRLRQVDKD